MKLKMKIVNEKARHYYENIGQQNHSDDVGFDLFCLEEVVIGVNETVMIDLGVSFEPVDNVGYLVYPRSSISKTPLRLANSVGVIDVGYRSTIKAVFDNIKDDFYTINKGDRLVQLVGFDGKPIEVEIVDELSETKRGLGGFGSTGV